MHQMNYVELVKDVYWTFILPLICVISMATSLINIAVFGALKTKNIIYKFMFYNCTCDLAYLLSVTFVFIMRCGQFCEIKDSYIAKFYHHYVFIYIANSLALYGIFMEIAISTQRIIFLTNKSLSKRLNLNVLLGILLVFSFVFYIPHIFAFEIKAVYRNETSTTTKANATHSVPKLVYIRENVTPDKSLAFRMFIGMQVVLRLILIVCLIFTLNYLTYYLFSKQADKKRELKNALSVRNRILNGTTSTYVF